MRSNSVLSVLIVTGIALSVAMAGQKPQQQREPSEAAGQPKTSAPDQSPDEKAIRRTAEQFVQAYNGADAKALAALFTEDAEMVDHDGSTAKAREAIEQRFAEDFVENPEGRIDIAIESIRFVCPIVAIEEGESTVLRSANEPADHSRYTVIHVKQGDKWLIANARELPDPELAAKEQLKQFEWLIGEWVDECEECVVEASYRWTDNERFILNEFTVQIDGRPAMTGTMRIGWDPLRKHVRSWIFDSEGGFAEGLWARQGDQWVLTLAGVTREGKVGSRTMVMSRLGKDRYSCKTHDCVVNGEILPDLDPVTVVRKPPKPLVSN
jgi:uncharacterized protein (TIGR02246 family)